MLLPSTIFLKVCDIINIHKKTAVSYFPLTASYLLLQSVDTFSSSISKALLISGKDLGI